MSKVLSELIRWTGIITLVCILLFYFGGFGSFEPVVNNCLQTN
jgi:hypothetical protein